MASISAAQVKALRDKTSLPMMECKRALVEAEGDEDRAIEVLREQFKKVLVKRAENATSEGRIVILLNDDAPHFLFDPHCQTLPTPN